MLFSTLPNSHFLIRLWRARVTISVNVGACDGAVVGGVFPVTALVDQHCPPFEEPIVLLVPILGDFPRQHLDQLKHCFSDWMALFDWEWRDRVYWTCLPRRRELEDLVELFFCKGNPSASPSSHEHLSQFLDHGVANYSCLYTFVLVALPSPVFYFCKSVTARCRVRSAALVADDSLSPNSFPRFPDKQSISGFERRGFDFRSKKACLTLPRKPSISRGDSGQFRLSVFQSPGIRVGWVMRELLRVEGFGPPGLGAGRFFGPIGMLVSDWCDD